MEHELKEALYALNRSLNFACDPPEDNNIRAARDQIWTIGVRLYGWRD